LQIYTPPRTITDIPVIDLSKSLSGTDGDRASVARQVHKACRETGFFYIAGHGLSDDLMAAQLDGIARFFDLPAADKQALDFSQSSRRLGYEPPQRQVLDAGSAPDLKESYMYAGPLKPDGARDGAAIPNLWPAHLTGFRAQMEAYHAAVGKLGLHVMRCVALSLDLAVDYFDESFLSAEFAVRLLRYPTQTDVAAGNQIGAGAHTDWGGVTLLLQDDCGGLEVQTPDGDWIRAMPIPGTLVVNLGDMLRRWTNDIYKSTLHRVLNNASGRNRHSCATFFSPRPETRVACIPSCALDRPPLYPPITAQEHIAEMVHRTYGTAPG